MNQHLDLLVAQSMAHERERDLRERLQVRHDAAMRAPEPGREVVGLRRWLHGLLVRAHLVHAPTN